MKLFFVLLSMVSFSAIAETPNKNVPKPNAEAFEISRDVERVNILTPEIVTISRGCSRASRCPKGPTTITMRVEWTCGGSLAPVSVAAKENSLGKLEVVVNAVAVVSEISSRIRCIRAPTADFTVTAPGRFNKDDIVLITPGSN